MTWKDSNNITNSDSEDESSNGLSIPNSDPTDTDETDSDNTSNNDVPSWKQVDNVGDDIDEPDYHDEMDDESVGEKNGSNSRFDLSLSGILSGMISFLAKVFVLFVILAVLIGIGIGAIYIGGSDIIPDSIEDNLPIDGDDMDGLPPSLTDDPDQNGNDTNGDGVNGNGDEPDENGDDENTNDSGDGGLGGGDTGNNGSSDAGDGTNETDESIEELVPDGTNPVTVQQRYDAVTTLVTFENGQDVYVLNPAIVTPGHTGDEVLTDPLPSEVDPTAFGLQDTNENRMKLYEAHISASHVETYYFAEHFDSWQVDVGSAHRAENISVVPEDIGVESDDIVVFGFLQPDADVYWDAPLSEEYAHAGLVMENPYIENSDEYRHANILADAERLEIGIYNESFSGISDHRQVFELQYVWEIEGRD